ncbi:MAG: glycosyltransferase family 39 protein [Rhodanobacteraceae bacterium]|nr:glycosyltransferase family 39 protein [Rhodanobacteraceae bacterium]
MDVAASDVGRWHRRGIWLLLAALIVLHLVRVPYAATHLDFARDVFVAWRFLQGEEVPLAGPVLAGTIHLGPVWYWLLALLLALTRSWLAVVFLLGLLSAAQIVLAFRLGRAAHSERAGLLWAALLALPSWSNVEWMLPQHYVLTAPLALTFLLCATHYVQQWRTRWLAGMALAFVLVLHAHPSSVGLLCIALGVIAHAAWRRELRWRAALTAAAVACLPLLPYLWWSIGNDFADFRAGGAYLLDAQRTGQVAATLPVLQAATLGGTHYWLQAWLAGPAWIVSTILFALAAVFAMALPGWWRLACHRDTRVFIVAVLFGVLAVALTTALIRHQTTYYMTTTLRVVALGAVALGLAALGAALWARALRASVMTLALVLNACCAVAAARFVVNGNWPFDFQALFDVTGPAAEPAPLLLLPAYAMRDSGEFLCGQRSVAVHGAYARHLLYDYAIEMRLGCARADAAVGGDDATRTHWLGLSRQISKTAGLVPERRVGSLALFPVRRVLAGDTFAAPDKPIYPVHLPRVNAQEQRRYRVVLAPGERLAISTMAFFIPSPSVEIAAATRPVQLLGSDSVTRLYACAGCAADESVEFDLRVTTPHFSDTDMVIF